MAMQDRAWRQTITPGTTNVREQYATDGGSDPNADVTLPTLVKGFQFTIPAGTFDAGT